MKDVFFFYSWGFGLVCLVRLGLARGLGARGAASPLGSLFPLPEVFGGCSELFAAGLGAAFDFRLGVDFAADLAAGLPSPASAGLAAGFALGFAALFAAGFTAGFALGFAAVFASVFAAGFAALFAVLFAPVAAAFVAGLGVDLVSGFRLGELTAAGV